MRRLGLLLMLGACAGDPDTVQVELTPSLISSLDGTTHVLALVAAGTTPLADEPVRITIDYTDRNGEPHAIDPIDAITDERGVVDATLTGLAWDGIGVVTVATGNGVATTATFTVLDRTPPKIEILPPTTDKRVGPGLPLDVQVRVTDEIGVSEVVIDGTGGVDTTRRTVVASGSQDTTLTFRMNVAQGATAGPSIQLYALASDLSGNYASATAMTLTVDPAITIATPPGLSGSLLVDGTANQLASPRAIGWSAKDSYLYVVDVAGAGACNPSCVWRVDPASGAIDGTPVYVGTGTLEGIAFDAAGDFLYLSDRQNRITRLAWSGTAYTTPTACNDTTQQRPQDPYHLVLDATLGLLAVDGNRKNVARVATCASTTVGQNLSAQDSFDTPRGIALGPTGEIYVADLAADRISRVDRTNGALTTFATNIDTPYGMEWLAGGPAAFADSLLVASSGDRIVVATRGQTALAAAYLRNTPIDLTVAAGTLYIVTSPSANNRGRIYKVGGF
jgi:hypothetical protein